MQKPPTPLYKKLGIKSGMRVRLINIPSNYFDLLSEFPLDAEYLEMDESELDFVHYFTKSESDLNNKFPYYRDLLNKTGTIWVSWPKKSSNVETDLSSQAVRSLGLQHGLVDVKVCSVDGTWSALKFMYRVKDR